MLHQIMLTLHVVAAVLFLGNIVITFAWKVLADRTEVRPTIAFAQMAVNRLDMIFTLPFAVILGVTGSYLAHATGTPWLAVNWMTVGVLFFALSGIIWGHLLLPLQKRQLAVIDAAEGDAVPDEYRSMCKRWNTQGNLATALAVVALIFMTTKPF